MSLKFKWGIRKRSISSCSSVKLVVFRLKAEIYVSLLVSTPGDKGKRSQIVITRCQGRLRTNILQFLCEADCRYVSSAFLVNPRIISSSLSYYWHQCLGLALVVPFPKLFPPLKPLFLGTTWSDPHKYWMSLPCFQGMPVFCFSICFVLLCQAQFISHGVYPVQQLLALEKKNAVNFHVFRTTTRLNTSSN